MTLKIKTPPMPEPWITDSDAPECSRHHYSADQLAARDAQWMELVGPVVEALNALLKRDEWQTCQHEETHRGGLLWTICNSCGFHWADDQGGKPDWEDPKEWVAARAALRAITEEQE